MKTTDFHAHPVNTAFRKAMEDLQIDVMADDGFPLPKWTAEDHIAFMDEAGIDYTVLSSPTPHIYNGDAEKARLAARRINDEIHDIVNRYPDRFGFVGCLPLPDVDGSVKEAEYVMDTLHAYGVKVPTNAYGVYLGDSSFDPLMEYLNLKKALVIIHPCRAKERPENVITGKIAAIYEYPADTTRAVINMIAHKIMTRYPDIRWIVPHCGSFMPYMLQRFTGVSGILANMGMMEKTDAYKEFSYLYFDIAGDPEPAGLNMLRMVADESHIVFGSDYPHSPAPVILAKKKHFDENTDYDSVREKIYYINGKNLLEGSIQ